MIANPSQKFRKEPKPNLILVGFGTSTLILLEAQLTCLKENTINIAIKTAHITWLCGSFPVRAVLSLTESLAKFDFKRLKRALVPYFS